MTYPNGDYPGMPPITRGTRISYVTQYTDPNQLAFFRDWISWVFTYDPGVKMDQDGITIVWYSGSVKLPLGRYVFVDNSVEILTEDELRQRFAPLDDFPEDIPGLFDEVKQPLAATVEGTADAVATIGDDTVDGLAGGLLNRNKGE